MISFDETFTSHLACDFTHSDRKKDSTYFTIVILF